MNNPKLAPTIGKLTSLLAHEGALSHEELVKLSGESLGVVSAALDEMVTTGIAIGGRDRSNPKAKIIKYVLSAAALREAGIKAAPKKVEPKIKTAKAEQAPEPVPAIEPEPTPEPAPEPEPETETTPEPVATPEQPRKAKTFRARRLAPNPMVGCFLHNGNIVIKLDRSASKCVSLSADDAEVFLTLLSSLITKAKGAAK